VFDVLKKALEHGLGPHASAFLDECSEEGPDRDDKKKIKLKKKKSLWHNTSSAILYKAKQLQHSLQAGS